MKIEYVDESKNMAQRLIAGELDAIITDISDTKMFESSGKPSEDQAALSRLRRRRISELYSDTGIFTPVHMIVMSRKLDREQPGACGQILRRLREGQSRSPTTIS